SMQPAADLISDIVDDLSPIFVQTLQDLMAVFGDADTEEVADDIAYLNREWDTLVENFTNIDSSLRQFTTWWNEHLENNNARGDRFFGWLGEEWSEDWKKNGEDWKEFT